jgi:hypothetical protein
MLYNRCMGIYKFGNNTYPRYIRHRSNFGHIFQEKSASYGPGNMLHTRLVSNDIVVTVIQLVVKPKFTVHLINFRYLINAWNMEHIELINISVSKQQNIYINQLQC